VLIRPLDPADGPDCDQVVASLPYFFGDQEGLRRCTRAVRSQRGWVAERSTEVVGFLTVDEPFPRSATNVCLDMQNGRERRARPMDLGPARAPEAATLPTRATATRIEPVPTNALGPDGDPADAAVARELIRLAFVAVLRRLPARQRAVLVLCEVLCWRATEAAQLLDMTVASVTSALQRARKTLQTSGMPSADSAAEMDGAQRGLLGRYVEAFQAYDIDGLTSLIKEDATQSISASDPSPRGPRDRMTPACGSAAAGAARTGAR
jgi:DNA-directed RNA polymerase specialized sigma24 family protein